MVKSRAPTRVIAVGFDGGFFFHSRKPCAFLESACLGLGGSSSRRRNVSKSVGLEGFVGISSSLYTELVGFDLCGFCCRGREGSCRGREGKGSPWGERKMARNAVDKATSIDAQLRLLAPQKLSDDDKLVEYDALLLDRFLDILQDLHGEDIRETVYK